MGKEKNKSIDDMEAYLRRQGRVLDCNLPPPDQKPALMVVIPAMEEPELLRVLHDLSNATPPECPVEVLVVFNMPGDAPAAPWQAHEDLRRKCTDWMADASRPGLRFIALNAGRLNPREAGVGLARKLGMDMAVHRLREAHGAGHMAESGIIACLDADCRVDGNYLTALHGHFVKFPASPGCALYFEHALEQEAGDLPETVLASEPAALARDGIARYELHLRVVVEGLRQAGHPHPFHTVGSAMAVRAGAYCRQGGMNRRKGAEDFYFLDKIFQLGDFTNLTGTTVRPSARVSARVPFGTGRAMGDWLAGRGGLTTHDPQAYWDLARLIRAAPGLWDATPEAVAGLVASLPSPLRSYLESQGFERGWMEMRANAAGPEGFLKRFWGWLNRFRVLKYMNHAQQWLPRGDVGEAAHALLRSRNHPAPLPPPSEVEALLMCYRELDRVG